MAASLRGALVERAAKVDRLTGAASRRVLEQRLEEAFSQSREEGTSLAIVLCDLDHFKRINDTYGHPTGDLALKTVAQVLLAPARGNDLCARYGAKHLGRNLCLLDTGQGRLRTAAGDLVEVASGAETADEAAAKAPPETPVFFA